LAGLDHVGEAGGFAVAHEDEDGAVGDEDLGGEDKAAALGGEEALAENAAEARGDARAYLRLLGRGEDVEEAVQGHGGVAGVHGADDEVAGLGGADGHLDGLEVAKFADDDDVGVFAEGAREGGGEGAGVEADLALGDVAAGGGLDDLYGVLAGDDVVVANGVELVDEGGEGGGLAGADGAGGEEEAVVVGEKLADGVEVAQAELVEAREALEAWSSLTRASRSAERARERVAKSERFSKV
jgi:hypothetical protein